MAGIKNEAVKSHALNRVFLALAPNFLHIAAITARGAQSVEQSVSTDASRAKTRHVGATTAAFRSSEIPANMALQKLRRILSLDGAPLPTWGLTETRVHVGDLESFGELMGEARGTRSHFGFEHRPKIPGGSLRHQRAIARGIAGQVERLEYIGAVQEPMVCQLLEEATDEARPTLTPVAYLTALRLRTRSIALAIDRPPLSVVINSDTCPRTLSRDPANLKCAREVARHAIGVAGQACDLGTPVRLRVPIKAAAPKWMILRSAIQKAIALPLSELQRRRLVLRTDAGKDPARIRGNQVPHQRIVPGSFVASSAASSNVGDHPTDFLEEASGGKTRTCASRFDMQKWVSTHCSVGPGLLMAHVSQNDATNDRPCGSHSENQGRLLFQSAAALSPLPERTGRVNHGQINSCEKRCRLGNGDFGHIRFAGVDPADR